jgi:hypothetical protein
MNTIGVVLDIITGHWKRAWNDMKKLVGQLLRDIGSTIKNTASNFGSLLYNAGKNVVKGLINGIKSMVSGVGSAISSVVGEIKNHLPWSPAKKGPLSGSGAPEIGGRNIVKLMAQGIRDAQPQIEAAMAHVTATVKAKQAATGSASFGASVAAGVTGPLARGAATGGNIIIDVHDNTVMSDRDISQLVDKIGKVVATRVLPAGGVRIRM